MKPTDEEVTKVLCFLRERKWSSPDERDRNMFYRAANVIEYFSKEASPETRTSGSPEAASSIDALDAEKELIEAVREVVRTLLEPSLTFTLQDVCDALLRRNGSTNTWQVNPSKVKRILTEHVCGIYCMGYRDKPRPGVWYVERGTRIGYGNAEHVTEETRRGLYEAVLRAVKEITEDPRFDGTFALTQVFDSVHPTFRPLYPSAFALSTDIDTMLKKHGLAIYMAPMNKELYTTQESNNTDLKLILRDSRTVELWQGSHRIRYWTPNATIDPMLVLRLHKAVAAINENPGLFTPREHLGHLLTEGGLELLA